MNDTLHVFLAGIMQGSLRQAMHKQGYREKITRMLQEHLPAAIVFDPFRHHPESLIYDEDQGRDVFFDLMDRAGQCDVLIAFLPEASMGTAIEMWNAYHAGAVIVAVTELTDNWVVRFLADAVVPDLSALETMIAGGGVAMLLENKIGFESQA